MIEITVQEMINSIDVLKEIASKKMPAKTAYKFARINSEIDRENITFQETRRDLVLKYGERDENGNLMHDTSTELVKGRQDVYKNLYDKFIKGLRSRNKLTPKNLEKKIHELEEEETYEEYAGVLLYFLKRDLKRYGRYSQKTQNIML